MPTFLSRSTAQFIKFGIVGVSNTIVDFGSYFLFTRYFHIPFLYANVLSWTIAVCNSFLLNKYWTFRSRGTSNMTRQYIKFFIVSLVALIISVSILYSFVTFMGFHDLVAKLMTIGIVLFWNFFVNKFWTFSSGDTHEA